MARYVGTVSIDAPFRLLSMEAPPLMALDVTVNGDTVRLMATERQRRVFAHLLWSLAQAQQPVYIETIDKRIVDVGIPVVGRVMEARRATNGDMYVGLERSAACHVLRAGQPSVFRQLLTDAAGGRGTLAVTSVPGSHEIRDVQAVPERDVCDVPSGLGIEQVLPTLTHVDPAFVEARVRQFAIDTFQADSMPQAAPVPFDYPVTYCWTRAHWMCRKFADEGVTVAKMWIYAKDIGSTLRARNSNFPGCRTNWFYHVVPVILVKFGDGTLQLRAIDPAVIGPTSVLATTYVELMEADQPIVEYSDMTAYIRLRGGRPASGECPGETEDELLAAIIERQDLINRTGGPPFRCG
jgi:hypothetical protein